MNSESSLAAAEIWERLMTVAKEQVELLKHRENTVGITLYGSLVTGDVTPFSDVDIILVIDGEEPEYYTEHRVVDGLKVDIKPLSMDRIEGLPDNMQESMHDFQLGPFLETMMLGDMGVILYDPDGKIASIRELMRSRISYREMRMADARKMMDYIPRGLWPKITSAYEKGDYEECVDRLKGAIHWPLGSALDMLAGHKDPFIAAERLGIPEICDDYMKLESLCSQPGDGMKRFHSALEDAWKYSLEKIYEPVKDALFGAGAPESEKLELICDHRAFLPYHGCRCMELGRAIAETNLSLRWMKFHIDEGRYDWALDRARFAGRSNILDQQWENISKAVRHSGYDVSELVNRTLQSEEYKQKAQLAREAEKELGWEHVNRENVEKLMQCVRNIRTAIEKVIEL